MESDGSSSVGPLPDMSAPENKHIAPEDLQTMVQLYQKHPKLWGAFKEIGHAVHLLTTTVQPDKLLVTASLAKIFAHFHKFPEDIDHIVLFTSVSGFVERGVSFARHILRDIMGKDYILEFPSVLTADSGIMCLFVVRDYIMNCAFVSSVFCQRLAKTGYLQDLCEDIKHVQYFSVEALERGKVFQFSLGTILNCCRFPESAAAVRQLDLVPHLTPFLTKRGENRLIHAIATAVIAHVAEDDQLELLVLDAPLLQYFLKNVQAAVDTHQACHNSWDTKEILCDLFLLARHDFNKKLMVAQGTLKVLHSILEPSTKRSEEEKTHAVSLISRLMEDQTNLHICQNYQELVSVLRNLADSEAGKELTDKAQAIWTALTGRDREDPDDLLSTLPHVAELLADQANVLSILGMGVVQFVVDEVKDFTDQLAASAAVRGEQASGQQALLALSELAAQEGCRREIMARGGADMMTTVVRRGNREDETKAVRIILELSMAPENRPVIQINSDLMTLLQDLKQKGDDQDLAQLAEKVLLALHSDSTKQGQQQ